MKKKKLRLIFGAIFLFAAFALVFAGNIDTIFFKDKSTGNNLTGVNFLLYTCNDADCSSIISQVQNLNSGSNNFVTYQYSSTENLNYGAYMFKACYLPQEDGYTNFGDEGTFEWTYEFEKASSCHSPIDSFSITNNNFANEPVVINVQANLEADAHSAFTNLILEFVPVGFENFYSAETKITLEIKNSAGTVVNTSSQTFEILQDTSQNVQFTWTPTTQGNYTAEVKTDVVDCQCQSSFNQSSQKQFTVLPTRPQNECYTIINNLEAVPEFATEGDLVTITFDKISNFADNSFVKTATQTNVTYLITDSSGNSVFSNNTTLSANPNTTHPKNVQFTWTPTFGGNFNIKVTGIANDTLCVGKTNTADTAILGFFAKSSTVFQATFIVTDSSTGLSLSNANVNFGVQSGTTDSAGKVIFNSNNGTFNWNVSKSSYTSKTGSQNVSNNITINVALDPISSPSPGGGGGSGGSGGSSSSSSSSGGTSHIKSYSFVQPGSKPIVNGESPEDLGQGKRKTDFGNLLIWLLIIEMVLVLLVILLMVRKRK